MKYGKKITEESYFDGVMKVSITRYEESIELPDPTKLLNELLSCADLILNNGSDEIDIKLKKNKEGKLRLVKTYRVQ